MSLNTQGIEELKLQLRRLANVPDVANEELKRCAQEVQRVARDMAPIDYGDLKNAIRIRETAGRGAGGRFVKGVREFEVYINNGHPVADPDKRKHDVHYVGEYAWLVHEYMGWGSVQGYLPDGRAFNPSDESRAEGLKHGVEAGGKFLERAGLELQAEISSRLAKVVFKYIEGLDF